VRQVSVGVTQRSHKPNGSVEELLALAAGMYAWSKYLSVTIPWDEGCGMRTVAVEPCIRLSFGFLPVGVDLEGEHLCSVARDVRHANLGRERRAVDELELREASHVFEAVLVVGWVVEKAEGAEESDVWIMSG
jgi:hypothetical protein